MPTFTSFLRPFVFLLCLFALSSAYARDQRLIVFGDSLSSGYHIDANDSWPVLMEKRLHESGFDLQVINASRKGETTDGGRSRLAEVLNTYQPTAVILALGANDGLRGKSLSRMKENLNDMVAMIRQSGAVPILVGMKLPPDFDANYAEDFSAVFAQTAENTHTPFVPFLLQNVIDNRNFFLSDQLHPNAAAQPKLLDTVWPVISQTLALQ